MTTEKSRPKGRLFDLSVRTGQLLDAYAHQLNWRQRARRLSQAGICTRRPVGRIGEPASQYDRKAVRAVGAIVYSIIDLGANGQGVDAVSKNRRFRRCSRTNGICVPASVHLNSRYEIGFVACCRNGALVGENNISHSRKGWRCSADASGGRTGVAARSGGARGSYCSIRLRAERGGYESILSCNHFDRENRRCDSYTTRPGWCRDYPRAQLMGGTYLSAFLTSCLLWAGQRSLVRRTD